MDIIYSRERIRISKYKLIFLIIVIILVIFVCALKFIVYPTYEEVCVNKAKQLMNQISISEINSKLNEYSSDDLVNIEKDENGKVSTINVNIFLINEITTDITERITNKINEIDTEDVYIRAGMLTGINILSGFGPKLHFKVMTSGNFSTNLSSEFYSTGINQSIHRIYLNITYNIEIITIGKNIEESTQSQILLVETVIVGDAPEYYYNRADEEYVNNTIN